MTIPTLKGVNKVIYDSASNKYVATGTATSTDSTTSVIQTSSDATSWTPMPYVSDPYGGAMRDGNATQEFDGLTYGEHFPPGTYYTDIGLPNRGFRLPIFTGEYPNIKWITFKNAEDNNSLIGLSSNLTTTPAGAYYVKSTNKGQAWVASVLLAPTSHASDEVWVDIETITISGTLNYVAVSNYGTLAKSTNGLTWSYDTTSLANLVTTTNERISKIARMTISGTETLIIISNNNSYKSTNLTSWTKAQTTPWANYPIADLLIDNGYLIVIPSVSSTTPYRYTRDGITWSSMTSVTTSMTGKQIVKFNGYYYITTTKTTQGSGQYYKAQILSTGSIPSAVPQPQTLSQGGMIQRLITFSNIGNTYTQLYLFLEQQIVNTTSISVYAPNTSGSFVGISSISSSDVAQVAGNNWISTLSTNGTATPTTSDYIVLISAEGNNLYRIYETAEVLTEAFTNFLNDDEYQNLADTLAANNSTTTRMYTGLFGVGDRLPSGSNWNLAATTSTKLVALDIGTGNTAKNDNYAVLTAGGDNIATRTWKDITYGCGKFVAVTQNAFEWTISGSTWNSTYPESTYHRRPTDASNYDWHTIAYQASNGTQLGRFYAIGNNISSGVKSMISYDGIVWSYDGTMPSGTWNASNSSLDTTVIVGASTNHATTISSSGYATTTLPATTNWNDIVHGNELEYHASSITASVPTDYTLTALNDGIVGGYINHPISSPGEISNYYFPDNMMKIKYQGQGKVNLSATTSTWSGTYIFTKPSMDGYGDGIPLTLTISKNSSNVWSSQLLNPGKRYHQGEVVYIDLNPTYSSLSGWNGLLSSSINVTINSVSSVGAVLSYTLNNMPGEFYGETPWAIAKYDYSIQGSGSNYPEYDGPITKILANSSDNTISNAMWHTSYTIDGGQFPGYSTGTDNVTVDISNMAGYVNEFHYELYSHGPKNFNLNLAINGTSAPGLSVTSNSSHIAWITQITISNGVYTGDYDNGIDKTLPIQDPIVFNYDSNANTFSYVTTSNPGKFGYYTPPKFNISKLGTTYHNVIIADPGKYITVGTKYKILGTHFPTQASPANDVVINVDSVDSLGRITSASVYSGSAAWTAPTFKYSRNKNVYKLSLVSGGVNNIVNNIIKIPGSSFIGGIDNIDDISITPITVDTSGAILTYSYSYDTVKEYSGRYFALGTGTTSAYSDDEGQTWSSVTMPSNQTWTSVAYSHNASLTSNGSTTHRGIYIAIASGTNVVAYSVDGQNWTQSTLPKSSSWSRVEFFKGRFIMLDGTRYPVVSNVITAIDVTQDDLGITWRDYGSEYLPYWSSTTMTDLVYDGTHYVGVGYGTLPSGSQVNLIWKSTTLSGAKASWRIYASTQRIQNLQLNGTDIVFKDGATISKFTSTFTSDTDTVGHFVGSTEVSSLSTIDDTVTRIEFTGNNAYAYYPDGSVIVYTVS